MTWVHNGHLMGVGGAASQAVWQYQARNWWLRGARPRLGGLTPPKRGTWAAQFHTGHGVAPALAQGPTPPKPHTWMANVLGVGRIPVPENPWTVVGWQRPARPWTVGEPGIGRSGFSGYFWAPGTPCGVRDGRVAMAPLTGMYSWGETAGPGIGACRSRGRVVTRGTW